MIHVFLFLKNEKKSQGSDIFFLLNCTHCKIFLEASLIKVYFFYLFYY